MPKRVFIIHGWEGSPDEAWFPWLKEQLEAKGFEVQVPAMPNPDEPEIESWVGKVKDLVGTCDENTFFVAHSIGSQTVLRYLQSLPEGTKVGGVVLVAPWIMIKPEILAEEGVEEVARPWLDTPIDWDKIKSHTTKFFCLFSDNDPYSPPENTEAFREKLTPNITIQPGKGHFRKEDHATEIPVVLSELLKLAD